MIRRAVPVLCLIAGLYMMFPSVDLYAVAPPQASAAKTGCNRRVAAFPSKYYNPDAGTGLLKGCVTPTQVNGTTYNQISLKNYGTTGGYVCWRDGTRAGAADAGYANLGLGNIADVCAGPICNGCTYGVSYENSVVSDPTDLFWLMLSTNDAGPVQLGATDGGVQAAVEYAQ